MNITILTILIVVGIFGIPLLIAFITNMSNQDSDGTMSGIKSYDPSDYMHRTRGIYGGGNVKFKYFYATILLIGLGKELYL